MCVRYIDEQPAQLAVSGFPPAHKRTTRLVRRRNKTVIIWSFESQLIKKEQQRALLVKEPAAGSCLSITFQIDFKRQKIEGPACQIHTYTHRYSQERTKSVGQIYATQTDKVAENVVYKLLVNSDVSS